MAPFARNLMRDSSTNSTRHTLAYKQTAAEEGLQNVQTGNLHLSENDY